MTTAPAPAPAADPNAKPRGLSGAVGIAIALAVLAMMSGAGSLGGGVLAAQINQLVTLSSNGSPGSTFPLHEIQSRILAASAFGPSYVVGGLALALGIWVLVIAVRVSQRRPGSAVRLGHAMLAFVAIEAASFVVQLMVQARIRPIMKEMMEVMTMRDANLPAAATDVMATMVKVMTVATMVFAVAWGVAKIAACLYIRHVVNKPAVRAWVDGARAPGAPVA